MVFFDTKRKIGQGEVGSQNLASGAVYRQKFAASAVGSGVMGTFSLVKAVGTLSSASIGSLKLSYGSAGSTVGRIARFGFGSFKGTVYSRVGSFQRFAGSVHASQIATGTVAVARVPSLGGAYVGTLAVQRIPSLGGAFVGTLAQARLPRQLVEGTITAPYGSFQGTVYARKLSSVQGSIAALRVGTVTGRALGSFQGSFYHRKFSGVQGTLSALRVGTLSGRAFGSIQGTMYSRKLLSSQGSITRMKVGSFRAAVAAGDMVASFVTTDGNGDVRVRGVQAPGGGRNVFFAARTGDLSPDYAQIRMTAPGTALGFMEISVKTKQGSAMGAMVRLTTGGSWGFGTSGPRDKYDFIGNVRFSQLNAGTVPAARVLTGTVTRARVFQAIGTHLNGSFSGNQTKTRYVVWGAAFPSVAYGVWAGVELRGTTYSSSSAPGSAVSAGQMQFHVGFLNKKAGSARFYIGIDAAPSPVGSVAPPGTVWLYGA